MLIGIWRVNIHAEFQITDDILEVISDEKTLGKNINSDTKNIIYESFKPEDSFIVRLENLPNKDRLRSYDSVNENLILRFY